MILLTGASGFIGKHLLKSLVNEFGKENILALTSKPIDQCRYLLHNNYEFDNDHFEKAGLAQSIDTIIHAGAFTPKNNAQANDKELSDSNISNTEKLLNAYLPKLNKIIYLSTLDVYGKDDIISEESPVEPASLYGRSKLHCEKLITEWANAENKIVQLLRVGHVYGPGEEAYQKLIPVTIKKLMRGETLKVWGTGKELRSFIYINDIVLAIMNSLELEKSMGVINLVSGYAISVRALIDKLIELSGAKPEIEILPVAVEGRDLVFDNTKMKAYLLQSETPLEEGLQSEWQYMNQLFR